VCQPVLARFQDALPSGEWEVCRCERFQQGREGREYGCIKRPLPTHSMSTFAVSLEMRLSSPRSIIATAPFMADLSRRAVCFANSITGCSCNFILDTEFHPYSGGECTIFAFEAEGRRIGVRIEQRFSPLTRVKVDREVQLLQAITRERIPHLPYLIGYDLESIPPLIATSWADGDKLVWTDSSPPLQIRKNILKTVAEVTLDLLKFQEPGKMPRDSSASVLTCLGGSALEWITDKIYRTRIHRSRQGNLPGVSVNDCEALLYRISEFHLPAFDDAPRVLVHGDLHASNIIMNGQQVEWSVASKQSKEPRLTEHV
jgi:hypothetical protein